MSPSAPPGSLTRAKRTLVPPVSQTRTGKGKAKSLIAAINAARGGSRSSGGTPFPGQNRLGSADSIAIRRRQTMPGFYEFFCGGGMARAGLEPEWRCLFANDIDPTQGRGLRGQLGKRPTPDRRCRLRFAPPTCPDSADLAWASFPCQDLSLAGAGAGLDGARSGAFWGFCSLCARSARAGTRAAPDRARERRRRAHLARAGRISPRSARRSKA